MKKISVSAIFLLMLAPLPRSWADTFPAEGGAIEITPLVHASVQLEYGGRIIQVDPWNVLGLPGARMADLILVTDSSGHHLDTEAIARLRKGDTPVIIAANGLDQVPDGIVLNNGESMEVAGFAVEAIAAYDIIPGAPEHPRGDANGYVIELGGKRLYFAGVTECVDEIKALKGIDVAFLPMNIPPGRMTPAAAAECARIIGPEVVYLYHYDQDYVRRLARPDFAGSELPGGLTVEQTLQRFAAALQGSGIEVRRGDFYPPPN